MTDRKLWQKHRIPATGALKWSMPTLDIFIRTHDNDLLVAAVNHGVQDDAPAAAGAVEVPEPESAAWNRWAFKQAHDSATFAPALPDRPVVVRPRFPLTIPVAEEVLFYVAVPLWVNVSVAHPNHPDDLVNLQSFPCTILSDTWFGNQMSGEFCYAVKSRARRQLRELGHAIDRAIVPVRVVNGSTASLSFQKICLRTAHLPIFLGDTGLWTGTLQINYQGKDQTSETEYGSDAPTEAGAAGLIAAAAKKPESSNLFRRSLGF